MFTVVFRFFGAALTNLSFILERYQATRVLLYFVSIRAVITAAITAARRNARSCDPKSGAKQKEYSYSSNHSRLEINHGSPFTF